MNLTKFLGAALAIGGMAVTAIGSPGGNGSASINGKVTLNGTPPKPKPFDLSKEPECAKMHASNPLFPKNVLTGPGNGLRNVVVYVSSGDTENSPSPPPATAEVYDQQGCHYTTHVLAVRVGQEVKISNNDPFSHNIHPLAKINREWNKMQPPGTPPFSYAFDQEEFIPIKCNIHPWMSGYFVVLRTSHFMVTGEDGRFSLPNLPPGHYVVTAWHEVYGTQNKEITVGGSESQSIDFSFTAKP
jgi:plastocyanin